MLATKKTPTIHQVAEEDLPSFFSVLSDGDGLALAAAAGFGPRFVSCWTRSAPPALRGSLPVAWAARTSWARAAGLPFDQVAADNEAKAFEVGAANVSLNDVMIDGQKAGIGFQFALQVRNKLVTAYNDIMQMQV